MRELTPNERIDVRIAVRINGMKPKDAAKRWGISLERVMGLCNLSGDGGQIVKTRYLPSVADEKWPELSRYMMEHNTNLTEICRTLGLIRNPIAIALRDGRITNARYRDVVSLIAEYAGIPKPKGGEENGV